MNLRLDVLAMATLVLSICIGVILQIIFSEWKYALAFVVNAVIGYVSLFFLVKDVQNMFLQKSGKFFMSRFIFRLACFAILLYLMLVPFGFNPLVVIAGMMLPIAIVLFILILPNLYKKF